MKRMTIETVPARVVLITILAGFPSFDYKLVVLNTFLYESLSDLLYLMYVQAVFLSDSPVQ